jgi:hypothetical protein
MKASSRWWYVLYGLGGWLLHAFANGIASAYPNNVAALAVAFVFNIIAVIVFFSSLYEFVTFKKPDQT